MFDDNQTSSNLDNEQKRSTKWIQFTDGNDFFFNNHYIYD